MISRIKNLISDLFFVKKWNIATIEISKKKFLSLKNLDEIENKYRKIDIKNNRFEFFADPFVISSKYLLAEGMNKKLIGKLVLIDFKKNKLVKIFNQFKKHISFPSIYFEKKNIFMIPEISHWSSQKIFIYNLKNNTITKKHNLSGLNNFKLKDPILFKKKNVYYLFFKTANSNKLNLYCSRKNILGPYKKVKNNFSRNNLAPRMGGRILEFGNNCYRIAQTSSDLYGDGISIFKIQKLTPYIYKEKLIRALKFKKLYGPHTINYLNNQLFFDYYYLKFDLFAIFQKTKTKYFM